MSLNFPSESVRETAIVATAKAMHECTSHPDYPSYDEAGCGGTPGPVLLGDSEESEVWHHQAGHERGARGVCWACEPLAAAAVDRLIELGLLCDAKPEG